jgi:hypothetical protein
MLQKSLKVIVTVGLIVSYVTLLFGDGYAAALAVKLIINPNQTDVTAGSEPVALTAKATGTGLTYKWELKGPGKIEGAGSAVFYNVPATIEGKSAQAIVTVTVTDASGQETTETVTFNILPGKTTAPAKVEPPKAEKKGMSTGTKVAIGAGALALVGGGIALAAGGGDNKKEEPFTGRFAYSFVDVTPQGGVLDCVHVINLKQNGNSLSGSRDMTHTFRGCCTLNFSVPASGVVSGNLATITYGSGEGFCSGSGGCWLRSTYDGGTFDYTLIDNRILRSGDADFIKQSIVGGSSLRGVEYTTTVNPGEGDFIRQ